MEPQDKLSETGNNTSVFLCHPFLFRDVIKATSSLISRGIFEFSEAGIKFRELDSSRVAMIDFCLPCQSEDKASTGSRKIGLQLEDLADMLDGLLSARPRALGLSVVASKDAVTVSSAGISFSLPLQDIQYEQFSLPAFSPAVKVEIDSKKFKKVIKATSAISDAVRITADTDPKTGKVSLLVFVSELGSRKVICTVSPEYITSSSSQGTDTHIKAIYSTLYLKKLARFADLSETVELSFATNSILQLTFKCGLANINCYLAPRIEEE